MKRLALPFGLVWLFGLAFAAPVLAAVPDNDTYAGRTVIAELPFADTLDTSDATTDAADTEWNSYCGAPATDASVWYEFTATEDGMVQIDLTADYSKGAVVLTGSPGSLTPVECYPYSPIAFPVTSDQTYLIVVFDLQQDEGGNGGLVSLVVDVAPPLPPPPTIDVTVDPVGTFNPRTGSATISGTVTCSADAEYAFIDVQLAQSVGRFVVSGYGFAEVWCDGSTQAWSAEVIGSSGLFKGGSAVAATFGVACNIADCAVDFEESSVRLRPQ
jgi:hypothetical protein